MALCVTQQISASGHGFTRTPSCLTFWSVNNCKKTLLTLVCSEAQQRGHVWRETTFPEGNLYKKIFQLFLSGLFYSSTSLHTVSVISSAYPWYLISTLWLCHHYIILHLILLTQNTLEMKVRESLNLQMKRWRDVGAIVTCSLCYLSMSSLKAPFPLHVASCSADQSA